MSNILPITPNQIVWGIRQEMAVTVEDVKSGKASIGSFIYDSSANATPTLATIFVPMKGVQLLSTGAKALKGAHAECVIDVQDAGYKPCAGGKAVTYIGTKKIYREHRRYACFLHFFTTLLFTKQAGHLISSVWLIFS